MTRKYGIIITLFLIVGIIPMTFAEIPTLNDQIEDGISINELQCRNSDHILVLRNNGNPACISEKTFARTNWEIIQSDLSTNNVIEQPLQTEESNYIQTSYAKLYPAPEGLKEPPQEELVLFANHIQTKYPNLYYDELFRSWNYTESWTQKFFSTFPDMKNKPTFVKDRICQDGVFFEDPLNNLNEKNGWFPWNYLDCINPELLLQDISTYDYIPREKGLNMLSNYYETDAIIERKVNFNSNIIYEPGPPCDSAYYHIFEYPQRVKIGEEFLVNMTYSWIKPNDGWGSVTADDKNYLLLLGEKARSIEMQEIQLNQKLRELQEDKDGQNQIDIIQLQEELDVLDDKLDLLHEQFYVIVQKYDDVNSAELDFLLDNEATNTSVGFDKKHLPLNCEPSIEFAVPRQMEFTNTEELDEYGFSDYSHRHLATKNVAFNNTIPQTQSFKFIVNEPVYDLYDIIEIGIGFQSNLIFTISTDDTYAYFGNAPIYHDFESRPEINFCCEGVQHPRPNHMGPPMILYADYLQGNHPNADRSFIENDLKISNIGNEEKYLKIFLKQYPEFNR